MSAQSNDIGLLLSQYDLYPPLASSSGTAVAISTSPGGPPLTFDFTLNGVMGDVPGIALRTGSAGGALSFSRGFITQYPGPWPAPLEVRAFQDGVQVDGATLLLHDTRSMVVARMDVRLVPNPHRIPLVESSVIQTRAEFYDAAEVKLPTAEVGWEVQLPVPVPGVGVDGVNIRVFPEAQAGDIAVIIRERSGLEQSLALTLLPTRDIQLTAEPSDLYPPLIGLSVDAVRLSTAAPIGEGATLSLKLNGVGGTHTGIQLTLIGGEWGVLMDKTFIVNFQGQWPIEAHVRVIQDGEIIGSTIFWLHDTRQMVCAKVDLEFSPTAKVQIPEAGETQVIAAPRFYDENGIRLPHQELDWGAEIVDPMEGVSAIKHLLSISPAAKPGVYRVAILGPNGLNRARPLTLY